MTDRQLMGFLTIVDKGSFTAAAEALYISQSALSQQVAQLEQQIGFPLFDRSARQATLTEAGKAFRDKAEQILSLYHSAVGEGKYLDTLSKNQAKRLVMASEGDQFLQLWMSFFLISKEIAGQFAPRAVRYDSRERLYLALQEGTADIAVQLENPSIARYGLRSLPFARTTELCLIPPGMTVPPMAERGWILPEDLTDYDVAFHNGPGISSYEDDLRAYFSGKLKGRVLNPADFFTSDLAPTVLLVPAIQHIPYFKEWAYPVEWGEGPKVCFVISPKCDERAVTYAQYIKEHITAEICPWYLPLE